MLCIIQLLINIHSNTMVEKITLIPMSATEILEADLERDERRKSELFRRECAV